MKFNKALRVAKRAEKLFRTYLRLRHPMIADTAEADGVADECYNACLAALTEVE